MFPTLLYFNDIFCGHSSVHMFPASLPPVIYTASYLLTNLPAEESKFENISESLVS